MINQINSKTNLFKLKMANEFSVIEMRMPIL